MKTSTSLKWAFTLMEIMIVVSIIGLLAVIAVPTYVKARDNAQTSACQNNLRQINAAKQQWAFEQLKEGNDLPQDTDLFGASLYLPEKPLCPASGIYTLNAVNTEATCSVSGHTLGY
jgi:prepilin-type N-terminal cleavage/methylation domain-containing protein